ncbi:hypothetical protein LXA43DRAFT_1063213 [Ganoderma leucocontextum]|nr:hypothetical protein LXA43DRAFT_1063213 [Ganoderma leucocontextum]
MDSLSSQWPFYLSFVMDVTSIPFVYSRRNGIEGSFPGEGKGGGWLQELQTVETIKTVKEATYIAEQSADKCAFLAHKPIDPKALDEVVLRIQGFLINLNLLPLCKYHISRNSNYLIDLKQSVTLIGRYLTSSRDAGEEPLADLAEFVDPFNVLRPLLHGEVHTVDNVVEYWEHRKYSEGFDYDAVKLFMFALTSLVEVQVSFMIVRVARQEYAFIPKLHAICLFNHMVESSLTTSKDYNISTICILASGQLSPLKKVKHKCL